MRNHLTRTATATGAMLLTFALLLAAEPSSAVAQSALAANCPGPRDAGTAAPANGRLAQVFRTQVSGLLTSAEVDVTKNAGSADWIVKVLTVDGGGAPTNTVLASAVVPDSTVPTSNSTVITATFTAPATVVAGQQYALSVARPGSGAGSLQVGTRSADECAGELYFSNTQTDSFNFVNGFDMVFAVFVGPDADGDGIGDANDSCPNQAGPASNNGCPITPVVPDTNPLVPDTNPPGTTITKGAPNKTDESKVKFKFKSDEAGSTFQCKVDKKPWKTCASPKTVKHLDDGKHEFKVRAVDAAGNVDPTAAKDKFKVLD